MRSLVLGAFLFASFGLAANAAEPPSDAKAPGHFVRRPACHWVTADRSLRLLRDTLPAERRIATERTRPIATPVKEFVVKVGRPVTPTRLVSRPEPIRVISRAEPAHVPTQHVSLIVGIGY